VTEGELWRLCVGCDQYAPRAVRASMKRLPVFGGARDDAILVASELVTNAVRHSLRGPEDLLEVRIAWDGQLRISVLDPGGSGRRAEIANRPTELGGDGAEGGRAAGQLLGGAA